MCQKMSTVLGFLFVLYLLLRLNASGHVKACKQTQAIIRVDSCRGVCYPTQVLDQLLTLLGSGSATATYNVDSCLAEVEDLLSYCNDILSTGDQLTWSTYCMQWHSIDYSLTVLAVRTVHLAYQMQ